MTTNIRRFAAVLSLTVALASTPAMAVPSRPTPGDPDRGGIVRVIQRLFSKVFHLVAMAEPSVPIP